MNPTHTARPLIRIRAGNFAVARAVAGLLTDRALGRRMGVDDAHVLRTLRGDNGPGAAFIAGALRAFPELKFEDLFTIEDEPLDDTADEAAVPA